LTISSSYSSHNLKEKRNHGNEAHEEARHQDRATVASSIVAAAAATAAVSIIVATRPEAGRFRRRRECRELVVVDRGDRLDRGGRE
jgi:hypothetical protein